MDVVRSKTVTPKHSLKRKITALVVCTAVLGGVFHFTSSSSSTSLQQSGLIIATVQRGDLAIQVDGYGVLRSNQQKLLTAQSSATVSEILLRPGAVVSSDSVILRMQDPDLKQSIETARMALQEQEANLRRQKLANQRERLSEKATQAQLESEYQSLVLRRQAQQVLRDQGVIPAIDVQTAELEEQQLGARAELQRQRITQLAQLHQEDIEISQQQVNQARSNLARLEQRAQQLEVTAGISGTIQRLAVELGQSVSAGQELAQVGSNSDLQALIRVPQSKAEQIKVGQSATIDTRRERVPATVTRITPQVQDGTIEVELSFSEGVPESARPELSVEAEILTNQLNNALYVERPANKQAHSAAELYVIQGEQAVATTVRFGADAGRHLQVLEGAQENQRVILSDMTQHSEHKTITLL
ncbi:HlyD family efflux transporter periplasmic adaptor subunit [Pseudoalteromonas sp. Of7M-16]|uniref:HlyD family secretion protein n=1 Tax=Pseudoalteromonas sp. Of7M-16 TaxID=2917756 RepID=UPI001EF556BC|nr:HlyD family efflux transporter periplasmic adaptor subunit [Pseudoalteromonas sp. Of7M-16]MCG7549760.1 HlyD family efflux transporter periplasmic adaptor subunit [Pseudoalteromonas sp. Of7M-16]